MAEYGSSIPVFTSEGGNFEGFSCDDGYTGLRQSRLIGVENVAVR